MLTMDIMTLVATDPTPLIDTTALQSQLAVTEFAAVIQNLLPIVGVAVLVGFLCYIIKWAVGLFRGI